jgi:hypothetical protein
MLTDDDLTRMLEEAAASFEVPTDELEVETARVVPLLRRGYVRLIALAASLVLLVVAVAALGGSTADQDALIGTASTGSPTFGGAQGGNSLSTTTGGSTGIVRQAVPGLAQDREAPGAAPAQAPVTAVGDGATARVVKTGTVTLLADRGKLGGVVTEVQKLAVGPAYVSSQSTQPIGDNPTATLTLRVPVASFDKVVNDVQRLGAKVVSVESAGKDVTAQYADTAAQITSLLAARARFLTILSGARTIGETLTVQQRIDDVQGKIDRLEGQRRLLESQSDLATVTVSVSEKLSQVRVAGAKSGLSQAFDRAQHGFSSGVEGMIAHSGRALLLLIVGGIGFVLARLGWRLARRRLV